MNTKSLVDSAIGVTQPPKPVEPTASMPPRNDKGQFHKVVTLGGRRPKVKNG